MFFIFFFYKCQCLVPLGAESVYIVIINLKAIISHRTQKTILSEVHGFITKCYGTFKILSTPMNELGIGIV